MPRNAAVRRETDATPAPAVQRLALSLATPEHIAAWEALVARCGGAQAAFEALVLMPSALAAAGIDPADFLRARGTPSGDAA